MPEQLAPDTFADIEPGRTALLESAPGVFVNALEDVPVTDDIANPIVCECLQVRLHTLEACVERGCTTQQEIARETGATTVCGSCVARVAQIVGTASGYETGIVEVRELLPSIRSFRFRADPAHIDDSAYPGQHVLVSAFIDGEWVSRPYTLTSPPREPIQEITVKREDGGVFSAWLFEQRQGSTIRVTPAQGAYTIDLPRREPIVLLVAGIGITPAIACARTFAAEGGHLVHIDYSVREADGFAFIDELRDLTSWCDGLSTRFRVSSQGERITPEQVRELCWRFPRGRFYVCGPASYQQAILDHLKAARVEADRIHVEEFTRRRLAPIVAQAPAPGPPPRKAARRFPNAASQAVGAILLVAYLAQGIFGWDWPWLQDLQASESYRRWSGAALLVLIALQWTLPIFRVRPSEDFRAVRLAYRWHRWAGALSPVFFYAHASWLGFGYLFALSTIYLANVAIGVGDKTLIADLGLRERYVRCWLVPHVALACTTLGLVAFHVFMVFAFK